MTESQAEAQRMLEKYGSRAKAAQALGLSKTGFRQRLLGQAEARTSGGVPISKSAPAPKATVVKSLVDFRLAYDKDTIVPKKIRETLTEVGAGWVYESEFVRMSGVTYADLGTYRDEFSEHIVWIKRESKRAWTGSVETAEQMRRML